MKLDPNSTVSQFVTFALEQEVFGVLIHAVEEIIILPEKITPVPKTPSYFSGMINLRGEVISVINLRERLALPDQAATTSTRILIVSISGIKIGMIVDTVLRVISVQSKEVRPPPAIIQQAQSKYIFGSIQQDDDTVLLLLDSDELINKEELSFYEQHQDEKNESGAAGQLETSNKGRERILIGFKLGHETYALDIDYVEEIIEVPKITKVPEMDHLVEGIFHQRSQALPILHLGQRFKVSSEITEESSVLIINEGGLVMGYIVDQITEVVRVTESEIIPPPVNISGRSAEQLEGIIKLQYKDHSVVVMALNISKILNDEEHEQLIELNEELNDHLSEDGSEDEHSEIISILKFIVGDEIFGIRVPDIDEICTMMKMVQVPKTPPFVNGVVNLRGDVITIIDLAKVFGNPPQAVADSTRLIIVEIDEQKAGFQVDEIIGIDHLPYYLFENPSGLLKGQYNLFLEGIGREPSKDEVIILLNVQEILIQSEMYDGEWGFRLLEGPEENPEETGMLSQ